MLCGRTTIYTRLLICLMIDETIRLSVAILSIILRDALLFCAKMIPPDVKCKHLKKICNTY